MNKIPRRERIDLYTPIEKAIYKVIQMIEEKEADINLTKAIILLEEAQDKVADYIDMND